jgi:hypothetical protein
VRGGGLYACGFAVTFIVLEVGSIAEDIAGIGNLFNGGIIDFVLDFFIDSFKNTLGALMWPVEIVSFAPPWGAIGLGFAFAGFTTYLKKPIERWLFDGEPADLAEDEQDGQST